MTTFLNTIGSINDETRVRILGFIHQNGKVCVCDIENSFNMIQSRISRHLKILKEGGFLNVERQGRWAYYSIRTPLDKFRKEILDEISFLDIDIPLLIENCSSGTKKVLILCTGNSCRSIISEALINAKLSDVEAYSSGTKASGIVNHNAIKLLKAQNIWKDSYHSKKLEEVLHVEFDLVVTVCDNAKESCPTFPKKVKTLHIGFDDPDGKDYSAFENTYTTIEKTLLPKVKEALACS